MTDEIIPQDVKQFLLQHIHSIAQWEGLIFLRDNAAREWDASAVAKRLYILPNVAEALLEDLYARGFLSAALDKGGRVYKYRPKSEEYEQMVTRAAELYKHYLVPITQIIHSRTKSSVQQFADAFKLTKD